MIRYPTVAVIFVFRRALSISSMSGLPLMVHHSFSTIPLCGGQTGIHKTELQLTIYINIIYSCVHYEAISSQKYVTKGVLLNCTLVHKKCFCQLSIAYQCIYE